MTGLSMMDEACQESSQPDTSTPLRINVYRQVKAPEEIFGPGIYSSFLSLFLSLLLSFSLSFSPPFFLSQIGRWRRRTHLQWPSGLTAGVRIRKRKGYIQFLLQDPFFNSYIHHPRESTAHTMPTKPSLSTSTHSFIPSFLHPSIHSSLQETVKSKPRTTIPNRHTMRATNSRKSKTINQSTQPPLHMTRTPTLTSKIVSTHRASTFHLWIEKEERLCWAGWLAN